MMLCPACWRGDCYGHVAEFLNRENLVRVCRCSDPYEQHGKRRPRQPDHHPGIHLYRGAEWVYSFIGPRRVTDGDVRAAFQALKRAA